jgi:hypothetical protein
MAMTDRPVPASLLSVVQRDLRPVRPLASPGRRALALVPVGLVLLIGLPLFWYWRNHLAQLAPWPSWPLSPLETAIGLVTLAIGFREAIPGRERPRTASAAAIAAVWIGFFAINALRAPPSAGVPADTTLRWIAECVAMVTVFSLPALAITVWLVARGLPRRPALTGAVCGLGIGMMADAGLRLCCWDGDTLHIVVAHGGAIAIAMALGALSGAVTERIKARRSGAIRESR